MAARVYLLTIILFFIGFFNILLGMFYFLGLNLIQHEPFFRSVLVFLGAAIMLMGAYYAKSILTERKENQALYIKDLKKSIEYTGGKGQSSATKKAVARKPKVVKSTKKKSAKKTAKKKTKSPPKRKSIAKKKSARKKKR